ncbi:Aste57867_21170 [Aphanomyces stellatus]|uniref:Aste57867_21170 protein n=1 Tax=Aphanomyces stellatus TaxID=120398 RepID=A0A485LGW7_9STRA|nr:hypothetical protein As57867_021102 [Aphanomyces stellatus]VFT97844.1 Aste57867_21170 [Aphanomyces stellatus]
MSFSFPSSNMSDVDMMFDVDPVPFCDLDIHSPDSDLDRHDLDMLIGQAHLNPYHHDMYHHHQPQHGGVPPPSAMFSYPPSSSNGHRDQIKVEGFAPPSNMIPRHTSSTGAAFRPPTNGGSSSPVSPPSSENSRSQFQTDEELLAQPVGNLTEEEKKLRRRAQVAKSARKHRKGVKEELEMLRQQVKYLQEQMALKCAVTTDDDRTRTKKAGENGGSTSPKAIDVPDSEVTHSAHTNFHHIYSHLNSNLDERRTTLMSVADRTMAHAVSMVMADQTRPFPYFDVSLNNHGPDMQFQLVRGKVIPGVDHRQLASACWNSVLDFSFDIPRRSLQGLVEYQKIMNLDADTRYGRIKMPILKSTKKDKQLIFMESLFLVRRKTYENHSVVMWNSVDEDDLFPEKSDNTLRNVEVGCAVLEDQTMPNGQVSTIMRCVVRSMPPVRALAEPRGKISEAFLTTWCRCSDFFDNVTRMELTKCGQLPTVATSTLQQKRQ